MKKFVLIIIVIVAGLVASLLSYHKLSSNPQKPQEITEKVIVQLKWVHQAQFAGMYVAKDMGYYKEEGLDVELLPFDFDVDVVGSVNNGDADFAVTGATDLIKAVANDDMFVKAIAVIYKKSPYALYTLKSSNIVKPSDFIGKRIGLQPTIDGKLLFNLMIDALGMKLSDFKMSEAGYNADELLSGKVDISTGYIINEPQQAIEKGYDVRTFLMADYGANMYGDVLIASNSTIANSPEYVDRFLRATLKGWEYAIEHPDEAVSIVLRYATDRPRAHEIYMLQKSIPLINKGYDPIGWMKRDEWKRFVKILFDSGEIDGQVDETFLFINDFVEKYYQ